MPLSVLFLCFWLVACPVSGGGNKAVFCLHPQPAQTIILINAAGGGGLSQSWLDAIRNRMNQHRFDSMKQVSRPLTAEERAWLGLIQLRSANWPAWLDSLNKPFSQIAAPDTVYVLAGFAGPDDAFTHGAATVCFDLTALQDAYGSASLPENGARADRLFAHEYTHLLSKRLLATQGFVARTFADSVLWECWYEGLGQYRSLSAKWLPVQGNLPAVTKDALAKLEPLFAANMLLSLKANKLSAAQKQSIQGKLSRGPVSEKWGAFPVAIWLALEARTGKAGLNPWVAKGPASIIDLARKYLQGVAAKRFRQGYKHSITPIKKNQL